MTNTATQPPQETPGELSPKPWSAGRYLAWSFWCVLAIFLCAYGAQPISDPDFWWHLSSGEVMLDQGSLLQNDPFNHSGDAVISLRESVILKGYWLWQGMAALFYRIGGLYGIFAVKMLTLSLLIGLVLWEMRRQEVTPFTGKVLIGLGFLIVISGYQGFLLERPQMFSFVFMTLLLGLLANIRLGRPPSGWLLPLMTLWSNIHGGFVVGDIVLGLFAAGVVMQYRHDVRRATTLLGWVMAGILASLVNPNGWNAIFTAFNFVGQDMGGSIDEYKSSWVHFHEVKLIGLLWLVAGLHCFGLVFSRKIFWPDIFVSLFLIAFGVAYLRNVPFVALSMIPMTGWYWDRLSERFRFAQMRTLQSGLLVSLLALMAWQAAREWDIKKNGWPIRNVVPVQMAAFLKSSGISGRLLNDYAAGGYLDWALYPAMKTFIDGRGLDYRLFDEYSRLIEGADDDSRLLNKYKIDVIALNIMLPSGRVTPLLELYKQPDWYPVYLDSNYFVLAKNTEKNSAAIRGAMVNKQNFMNSLLNLFARRMRNFPGDIEVAAGYASLLVYAERFAEAEFLLNKIAQARPDAKVIQFLRNELIRRRMNYYRALGG